MRDFAKALAQEVVRRVGDEDVATTTWRVADRRGVFVDYGQNARDRTIACAYSIRPMPDARASAPMQLGRGRRERPSPIHARDDARARLQYWRPYGWHVAAEGKPLATIQDAGTDTAIPLTAPCDQQSQVAAIRDCSATPQSSVVALART